jgi:addiction module HigA family antidote
MAKIAPHPGRILRDEFLAPLGRSASELASFIGTPTSRIERVIAEEVALTPGTAARLARAFPKTTSAWWLSLQTAYDVERVEAELGEELAAIEPFGQRPAWPW